MITEKIAEAKLAKRKLFFRTLLIIILLSILCVLIMLWLSAPKSTNKSENESNTSFDIVEISPVADNLQDKESLRQAYLEAYAHYENTLKPELNKIDLQNWNPALFQRLTNTETSAIKQFGEAKYAQAKATLDGLIQLSENTINDSKDQFATALQDAQQAFDNNNYQQAKSAINKALMLDTTSQQAEALAERIEQLPEIASLVEQIRVAEVENNPQAELKLINELLSLAPEREALKQRARTLQTNLNDNEFQLLIAQSYTAVENGRIAAAKSAVSQARDIYPNRPELNDATSAIQQYEKTQRVQSYLSQAKQAESQDDWQTVKTRLEQMLDEAPNNKTATEKLAVANTIVTLKKTIDDYLQSPYRLSNAQLADQARAAINKAESFQNQSISLTKQRRELENVLEAVNRPIPVEVRSDNQTYILVRGVGNVGVIDSKVIQLKPGQYTFEGKRQGFKSKIVEVTIPYNLKTYSLRVVCDEPI